MTSPRTRADNRRIEPLGFFTLEALKAGWYLAWRVTLGTAVGWVVPIPLGIYLVWQGMPVPGAALILLGVAATVALWVVFTNRFASRWAERHWGRPLARGVWWAITWRVFVVGLVAGVVAAPIGMLGSSLQSAYEGSVRGGLGTLLQLLLSVLNVVVSVLAYGWALSRVVASRLGGFESSAASPVSVPRAAPAPAMSAVAVGAAASSAAVTGRPCPKCGLAETERGQVIGWYCRVCGWRESRR